MKKYYQSDYSKKLKNPNWQKKRLEIFERDEWACQYCGDTEEMLTVHHLYYEKGHEPWEYPNSALVTACDSCHQSITVEMKIWIPRLIQSIKKAGFTGTDFEVLSLAFDAIAEKQKGQIFEPIPHAIRHALQNEIPHLLDLYFEYLRKTYIK